LGLAIVRHLVELHDGSVHADSEGLGNGSTFTVRLPLAAEASFSSLVPAHDEMENHDEQVDPESGSTSVQENAPRLCGLHILVVDDANDIRGFLTAVLEKCGACVTAVASASEGIRVLQEVHPHILLSDIGMPGEDGFSLLRQVRALTAEQGGQTPAIALTAFARIEDRAEVLRSGFQAHLPKPIDTTELVELIAALVGAQGET
jgi:CheY-like chemotaxis protein